MGRGKRKRTDHLQSGLSATRPLIQPSPTHRLDSAADDFVEIEGSVDLIVEIVSDSSVRKDTQELPIAYFAAGVREYWIADARGDELVFHLHHRGSDQFEPTKRDHKGFQRSAVLDRRYRLERGRDQHGFWRFELIDRE